MTATIPTPTATQPKNYASRPMNGDEYIESLRDGREIYIYGERVKDVTTHPGLPQHRAHDRAAVRRAARPDKRKDKLTCCRPTPATAA